ncbi:MAG TPA: saccharopine dehydrogenase C-terminal domain-containing protein [Actinomycetota bacterium]|nr:saccharopine dehydrogenase C-terminal domain-containing protein [Actinomycetota bacterium]
MGARLAVLGAGAMGSAAAVLLARHREDVELLVLDADADRARTTVRRAGHGEARGLDAAAGDLAGELRGVDAVANCLPYRLNLPVMEAALAAGCHYADLGGLFHTTRRQLELDPRFRDAGRSAVLGIGSAPGLTNVLARLGADRLDRVVSIDLVDGSVDVGEERFAVPYSAQTVLDEFTLPAVVFEDGELREVPAGSGVVDRAFPEPVGVQPAMYTLHSEPATLPFTIPGVRNVRWRLALPRAIHDGFRFLVDVGLASTEPVETPRGPAIPREVLVAVLDRLPQPSGPPRDVEYLDVRVEGERGGRPATHVALARFDPSPEGLSAGAFGTALPIAIAVRWMAEGRVQPGVHPPETAFDPVAFVAECERQGIGFSTELLEG